jgi:hypothetical protein
MVDEINAFQKMRVPIDAKAKGNAKLQNELEIGIEAVEM